MSYFSRIRIKCDKEKCISCGKCKRVCPMNVDVTDNSRKRGNESTLDEIIEKINEKYNGKFTEEDRVILGALHDKLIKNEKLFSSAISTCAPVKLYQGRGIN